jgi:hypothetical protein
LRPTEYASTEFFDAPYDRPTPTEPVFVVDDVETALAVLAETTRQPPDSAFVVDDIAAALASRDGEPRTAEIAAQVDLPVQSVGRTVDSARAELHSAEVERPMPMDSQEVYSDEIVEEAISHLIDRASRPLLVAASLMITLVVMGFSLWRSALVAAGAFVAGYCHLGRRSLQGLAVLCVLYALAIILEIAPKPLEIKGFVATSLAVTAPAPASAAK